jgi:hypothetical protein
VVSVIGSAPPPPFRGVAAPRLVNQHLTHRVGGNSAELCAILPVLSCRSRKLEVRLVNELGRRERRAAPAQRQLPSRDLLQRVVDHRQKQVERVLVAVTHLFEQPSELTAFIGGRRHLRGVLGESDGRRVGLAAGFAYLKVVRWLAVIERTKGQDLAAEGKAAIGPPHDLHSDREANHAGQHDPESDGGRMRGSTSRGLQRRGDLTDTARDPTSLVQRRRESGSAGTVPRPGFPRSVLHQSDAGVDVPFERHD